ncbi:tRNA (cmo5U34)-methyltransferase [Candidatus Arsenophonus lipoptenae]|uniref:Carboxy-S-adenosyl-L-methionine synthase n=1 Tax=Candidatus Arsenophonus lipoptenae TaxID=634113 RepID=A0A0X9VJL4_9GAMM|nr:carboxy-S-adenosyl-L-methionine synthase CmoA [Candidatus Arsenophonus lipoptenae]AMA65200.1 tRNA (cmo5U34)-methyltransferase [Candidatus Arsenophonus lipoptenae]
MFLKDRLLTKPIINLGDWQFDKKVVEVFPDMIRRSIPGYSNIITMIGILVTQYVTPNSIIYDLGCSLGTVTLSILRNIRVNNCKIIAIDNSAAMIKHCKRFINKYRKNTSGINTTVEIIKGNLIDINIENASMVILNFTLQFISPSLRQQLINRIYQGMNPGGILMLSEKFNFENQKINSLLFKMHYNFKRANGYSELEIHQKYNMLKNIMLPDSIDTHKLRFKTAGFNNYDLWFQCFNFGSLIAIKD